jgi:mRNA interferase RelE/StbE
VDYQIQWTSAAVRELESLSREVQERVLAAVDGLVQDPRPPGVRKRKGQDDRYRIRVEDWRVFYELYDRVLAVVVKAADRKDAYPWRERGQSKPPAGSELNGVEVSMTVLAEERHSSLNEEFVAAARTLRPGEVLSRDYPITIEEFCALGDEVSANLELAHGVLYMSPPPS